MMTEQIITKIVPGGGCCSANSIEKKEEEKLTDLNKSPTENTEIVNLLLISRANSINECFCLNVRQGVGIFCVDARSFVAAPTVAIGDCVVSI